MNRYYKPTKEEFVEDLEIEVYDPDEHTWLNHVLSSNSKSAFLPLLEQGDIRVKYLNTSDFEKLGCSCKLDFLHVQDNIVDYKIEDGEEVPVIEKIDVYDEQNINIWKDGVKIGTFHPYERGINFKHTSGKYLIKNLTELRKVLK